MSDIVLVALITGASTLLVSALGTVGGILLEGRRKREADKQEIARAFEENRFQSALDFSESLYSATMAELWSDRLKVSKARTAFVSTLRKGEGQVGAFTLELMNDVLAKGTKGISVAHVGVEMLFEWLRDDIRTHELTFQNLNKRIKA